MRQGTLIILTGVLLIIAMAVFVFTRYFPGPIATHSDTHTVPTAPQPTPYPNPTHETKPNANEPAADVQHATSVENYIKEHISDFTPVKTQLGGTFHVTQVDALDGAGSVSFEDAHTKHSATFTYSIDEFGSISIDTFVIKK